MSEERAKTATEVMLELEAERNRLVWRIVAKAREYEWADSELHEMFEELRSL